MAGQFQNQGGTANMDPGPLARWLTSKVMSRLSAPIGQEKKRIAAEKQRVKAGEPHRVEYFHQVEDGYSHLAAQVLRQLVGRYDIELTCHLVAGPQGKNSAEPELLLRLSRYDSCLVAPGYGLDFPRLDDAPDPAQVKLAAAILAAQDSESFIDCAAHVGHALWAGNDAELKSLAERHGSVAESETNARIAAGTRRREELKHYSGAMFYYGQEWYWGVDRLYHLEKRLAALGADRDSGQPMIAPRPPVAAGPLKDSGSLTLEIYPSVRSPYTAVGFDQAVQLAQDSGVSLVVRPVLPMVMRGVPLAREKGRYILMDAAREAREAGVPYGNIFDPIGDPARRCYSLYSWAVEQGRGTELLSNFLSAAWAQGINTNKDRGLKQVVEGAGLDWDEAKLRLDQPGWEKQLEENRLAMYEMGLWGVPSFRLLNESGEQLLACWGQDRLWLLAREIQRHLVSS